MIISKTINLKDYLINTNLYGGATVNDPLHLVIPEGTTEITRDMVPNRDITSVTIPNSVTSIGDRAFSYTPLTSVTIPDSVTSIGPRAFYRTRLTSVTIPDSVTSIGVGAFYNTRLTSVTIPNSVTSIGYWAFARTQIRSVTIPNSVTNLHADAFDSTVTITRDVSDALANDPLHLVIPDGTTEITRDMVPNRDITSVTIPSSVTSIGGFAFYNTRLTSVTIPNSVTSIGNGAFSHTPITSITIPNGVTSIREDTFLDTKLTSITIPNSVTSIGPHAFSESRLRSVTIPNSVTSIGQGAFFRTPLTSVTIPNSVRYIGRHAFNRRVTITRGDSDASVNDPLHLVIPEGTIEITRDMVPSRDITSVTIPNSVTHIGSHAFASTQLRSVTIPNSVTSIGNSAFYDTPITSVTIPDSVTSIGGAVFYNTGLTSVTIPNSVTSIGVGAFYNTPITNVTIPNSVINLHPRAFDSNVTITRGVSNVGESKVESKNIQIEKTINNPIDLFLESITSANEDTVYMDVSRGNVFNSLKNYGSSVFYKGKWSIKFNDERGIDMGGLRRDFFTELAKELVHQNYFIKDNKGFHLINQKSSEDNNTIKDYEFIGKLFAYVVKSNKSEFPNNINLKLHPYLLNALLNSKYGERSHDLTKTYGHSLFDLLDASDINILDKIPYILQFISKELKYSDRKVSNTNDPVNLLEMIRQYNHNLLEALPISTYVELQIKTEDEWTSLNKLEKSFCLEQNGFICDGFDEEHLKILFPYDKKDQFIDFMIRINLYYRLIDEFEAFIRGFHSILEPSQMTMLGMRSLNTLIVGETILDIEEFLVNFKIIGPTEERKQFILSLIRQNATEDETYLNELLYLITGKKTLSVNKYKEFGKKLEIKFRNQHIDMIKAHTCNGHVNVEFSNKLLINGTDGSSDELLTNMFKKEKIMSVSGGEFCQGGGAYQTIKLSDYKV